MTKEIITTPYSPGTEIIKGYEKTIRGLESRIKEYRQEIEYIEVNSLLPYPVYQIPWSAS